MAACAKQKEKDRERETDRQTEIFLDIIVYV